MKRYKFKMRKFIQDRNSKNKPLNNHMITSLIISIIGTSVGMLFLPSYIRPIGTPIRYKKLVLIKDLENAKLASS
jgi:hypothetical protein